MGADRTPLADVTLALYADSVSDDIVREPEPVLVVGHSMGGITISEVAERIPHRLLGLVYLSPRPIPGGMSMVTVRENEIASRPGAVVSSDGLSITYDPAQAVKVFYNNEHGPFAVLLGAQPACRQPYPDRRRVFGQTGWIADANLGRAVFVTVKGTGP